MISTTTEGMWRWARRLVAWGCLILLLVSVSSCGGGNNGTSRKIGLPPAPPGTGPVSTMVFTQAGRAVSGQVKAGWNYFSLPYVPGANSAVVGVGHIEVYRFDTQEARYVVVPEAVAGADLLALPPGIGVWVFAEEDGQITLEGNVSETSVAVRPGWNSIGVLSTTGVKLADLRVVGTGGTYVSLVLSDLVQMPIYAFDAANGGYTPISDPETVLLPGNAYWLYGLGTGQVAAGQAFVFQPLAARPAVVVAGTTTEVTFSIGLDASLGTPTVADLRRVDAEGQELAIEATLVDNGDVTQGDDIPDDRLFNARIVVSADAPGGIRYQARVVYNAGAGDATLLSDTVEVLATGDVTHDQLVAAGEKSEDVQTQLETAAETKPPEEAAAEVLTALLKDPEVAEAGVSGSGAGLWWVTQEGLPCVASAAVEGTQQGGGRAERHRDAGQTAGVRPGGRAVGLPRTFEQIVSLTRAATPDKIDLGNKRAIFLACYNDQFGAWDMAPKVYDQVCQSTCPDFDETILYDDACTVEQFKTINQFGLVVINTHGDTYFHNAKKVAWDGSSATVSSPGGIVAMLTRTPYNADTATQYKADLTAGRLVIAGGAVLAITPAFVDRYLKGMPRSLVWGGACRSLANQTMAAAFHAAGAKAYLGFSNIVYTDFNVNTSTDFFARMLSGDPLGTAFTSGQVDKDPYRAEFRKSNGTESKLVLGLPGIENGSFEDALAGWTRGGDARAIAQLGPLVPQDGKLMAIVSTGLGSINDSDSSLSQRFCVPSKANELQFWYDVVSEEPMEYVGSVYDDRAYIELGPIAGPLQALAAETVNTSFWNPISGINFFGGDDTTFHTGWKKVVGVNLVPYRGSTQNLVIRCFDRGDSIYDTAILVDKVEVISEP